MSQKLHVLLAFIIKVLHILLAGILCLQLQDTCPKAFQSYSVFEREFRFL